MILLNNSPLEVEKLEFPILINGADKTGASYFSIELLTEMYAQREDPIRLLVPNNTTEITVDDIIQSKNLDPKKSKRYRKRRRKYSNNNNNNRKQNSNE
jgi:hypothetical protein